MTDAVLEKSPRLPTCNELGRSPGGETRPAPVTSPISGPFVKAISIGGYKARMSIRVLLGNKVLRIGRCMVRPLLCYMLMLPGAMSIGQSNVAQRMAGIIEADGLRGYIYADYKSTALAGATVGLCGADCTSIVRSVQIGSNGWFSIPIQESGQPIYHLRISAPGYTTYYAVVHTRPHSGLLKFVLVPNPE